MTLTIPNRATNSEVGKCNFTKLTTNITEIQIHTSVGRSTGNKFMAPALNSNPLKMTECFASVTCTEQESHR